MSRAMGLSPVRDETRSGSEEWRAIPGHPAYEVSSLGRVRSVAGAIRLHAIDRYGYPRITLHRDNRRFRCSVHRLVCEAFHGPPFDGAHVAHLDHDKSNNRAENLAWVTREENDRQNEGRGLPLPPVAVGSDHPCARLDDDAIRAIRARVSAGERGKDVAAAYGISKSHVTDIVKRRRWSHVE